MSLSQNELDDPGEIYIYLASLYFHFVTIFTVGYGDITAANMTEKVYVSALMILGISCYFFIISALSYLFSKQDANTIRCKLYMDHLFEMSYDYNMSNQLYNDIESSILQLTKIRNKMKILR